MHDILAFAAKVGRTVHRRPDAATEIEVLRERVRELEALVAAPALSVPPEWGLTRRMAQVFSLLLVRDRVTKDMLCAAFEPEGDPIVWESHISKMRDRLEPFGISITTQRFEGYSLVDRQRWRTELEARLHALARREERAGA